MKKRSSEISSRAQKSSAKKSPVKKKRTKPSIAAAGKQSPANYVAVLADMKQLIADSRHRALATVNRELVFLYWQIGQVIVKQQESAKWGDGVVEQLATDLRLAFPDMKGLSLPNVWRMRQFFRACRDIDLWLNPNTPDVEVGAAPRLLSQTPEILSTLSREFGTNSSQIDFLSTLSGEFVSTELIAVIPGLSWSGHTEILAAASDPAERYFYMQMSARERWSVRELRRQIDSGLFLRYMSVRQEPEKCLPAESEKGDLLPFKDRYILEFLGLSEVHSERELRKSILANLRDFFLEFGRDLTFVGEEYPLTVGNDIFRIDLLFFHRRLQCLISVDLKIGDFQPEYVGKSLFYVAALDEQIRLKHERPSIGLILCRNADDSQVRLALSPAAKKIGVATYETALPETRLIRQRLEQFSVPKEDTK